MFESNDYRFYCYKYSEYHHTDMSMGSDIHYLAMLLSGSGKIRTETDTLSLHCGDVFYIPRGLKYHSYWRGDPEIEFLSFGFLTMPAPDQKNYLLQVLPPNEFLAGILRQIPLQGKSVGSCALSLFYSALTEALAHMTYSTDGSGAVLWTGQWHTFESIPLRRYRKLPGHAVLVSHICMPDSVAQRGIPQISIDSASCANGQWNC